MNKPYKCCFCGKIFKDCGNNPEPVISSKNRKCCDSCNIERVIPARLVQILGEISK